MELIFVDNMFKNPNKPYSAGRTQMNSAIQRGRKHGPQTSPGISRAEDAPRLPFCSPSTLSSMHAHFFRLTVWERGVIKHELTRNRITIHERTLLTKINQQIRKGSNHERTNKTIQFTDTAADT